jgi:hypothetical protein
LSVICATRWAVVRCACENVSNASSEVTYALGLRSEFRQGDTPANYFDLFWRAMGVDVSALTPDERRAYDAARAKYVQGCTALMRSAEKRAALKRAHVEAERFAAQELAAGRHPWGVEVPSVASATTSRTPRAREAGSTPRAAAASSSKRRDKPRRAVDGGDADDPGDEPPDVARRERVLRRGGAR